MNLVYPSFFRFSIFIFFAFNIIFEFTIEPSLTSKLSEIPTLIRDANAVIELTPGIVLIITLG